MPRKGTETKMAKRHEQNKKIWKWDALEGDGNSYFSSYNLINVNLEMRCPGRGRKRRRPVFKGTYKEFGNEMPRKGTETYNVMIIHNP